MRILLVKQHTRIISLGKMASLGVVTVWCWLSVRSSRERGA